MKVIQTKPNDYLLPYWGVNYKYETLQTKLTTTIHNQAIRQKDYGSNLR